MSYIFNRCVKIHIHGLLTPIEGSLQNPSEAGDRLLPGGDLSYASPENTSHGCMTSFQPVESSQEKEKRIGKVRRLGGEVIGIGFH